MSFLLGIPYSDIHLRSSRGHAPKWSPDSSTSEVTTIQLEFRDLSRCTNDNSFEKAVSAVSRKVHNLPKTQGLVPIFTNPNTGKFRKGSTITLGARGDSYYEYLLKQWVQTGKTENYLRDDFVDSVIGVSKREYSFIRCLQSENQNDLETYLMNIEIKCLIIFVDDKLDG